MCFPLCSSVIAGDPDFSLGNYFQMRSESISFGMSSKEKRSSMQPREIAPPYTPLSMGEITPHVDNKTYTKLEATAKLERNLIQKMQQEKLDKARQVEATKKKPPTSSEIMSLSAIDAALRECNFQ